MDMHALRTVNGKLREIELVYVGADERVCLGLIGNNAKRFCRTRGCKVKAHRKTRFGMSGARGGWFIPAKTPLNGGPTAFVEPFLDVNKITEDTATLLKIMEKQTTADWVHFVGVCHYEWNDLEAQSLLDNIQEVGGDDDEDEMEEDDEEDEGEDYDLCEGNLEFDNPPADFVWEHALEEATLKSELDKGSPKNSTKALEELTAAFGDLEGMVVESRRGSRQDALDVLTHVGLSVTDIVAAINRIVNKRGRRWVSQIGRIEELRKEIGHDDVILVEAVLGLGKTMMAGGPPEDLSGAVEDLTKTIDEVDHDLVRNCTLLNTKIQALERQQVMVQTSAGLTLSTPIFDDSGNQVSMLGRVMQDNIDLTRTNELLKGRIERLAADVTAQGGVMLGKHTFTSELQLMELCMRECPAGNAFSAFVNPMVIFCHDASYSPFTGWETITKAMEKSGTYPVTDRKVVASYNAHHSHWFSEGKTVVAGKALQAFASKEKWQGTGGMDGRHDEIELSLGTAADSVRTAVEDKLPEGSQLRQLALRMLDHTLNWFSMVFKHLDSEFARLTQVNISEEETLILLSVLNSPIRTPV